MPRRARDRREARGALACQWDPIHQQRGEKKTASKTVSHLTFVSLFPFGPFFLEQSPCKRTEQSHPGSYSLKRTFAPKSSLLGCNVTFFSHCTLPNRDFLTPLSTTIHEQGIWESNPALLGQVYNDLNNAAIATYLTQSIIVRRDKKNRNAGRHILSCLNSRYC